MLFKNPRRLLSESATADLLNPEVSDEVKDVIVDLEKDLTNNVEEVKEEDKTTNGGIPVTTESVAIMESSSVYGKAKYLVTLESVMAVMESEAEAILSNMNNAIRNGIVYIADAQFVKEHNLEAVYAHLITDAQLKELLSMNAKHVVDVYKNANDTQKQVIIDMVSEKKLNGQEIDANILIELGKLCRKDLISIEPIEEEG